MDGVSTTRKFHVVVLYSELMTGAGSYTYTPALLNSATTPKPASTLAVVATAVSRIGSVSLGILFHRRMLNTRLIKQIIITHVEK